MTTQLALERPLQRRIEGWIGLVIHLISEARGVLKAHVLFQFLDCFKGCVALTTQTCAFI